MVLPPPQTTPDLPEASEDQSKQEVTPELLNDFANDIPSVEEPCRYELPPRSTRGIPPRRYNPKFEAQRSRYPTKQGNIDTLS